MRQFFTFRFWLSIVAVIALLAVLYVQVRQTDVGEPAHAGGPTERNINMITRILAARLEPGWTVRDGETVGAAEFDTGFGPTLAIKPGTLGELQCDALATPGGCYLLADTLGNAVIWFVVLPYPATADEATLPAIEFLLDDVTSAELTNGWILPLASVVDRSACPVDTSTLTNFVSKFGTKATTTLDVARQRIVAVDCTDPDESGTTTTVAESSDSTVAVAPPADTTPPG